MSGRVFVRQTVSKATTPEIPDAPTTFDQDVASARLSVEYRHHRTLKTAIEVELGSGEAELKDAYVRWRPLRSFGIKAGHIKRPISAIQLEGLWDLPIIERGLLSDLEFNTVKLPFGGRSTGVALEWEPRSMPVTLTLGAFEPDVAVTLDAGKELPADVYARVELAVAKKINLGASFGWVGYLLKPDKQEGYRHAPVASVDAHVRRKRFELWVDAFTGVDILPFAIDVATLDLPCTMETPDSPPVCPPAELIADRGLYIAGRAVAALRLPGVGGARELQPFASGSIIDLNVEFVDDEVAQVGIGLAARITKRLRVQAELDRTWARDDAPAADVTAFALQLGAAF